MSSSADIAIIGAGMAGASLAAEVAAHASAILIEAEAQPGYHSTGRSAAFWAETYGGPDIQPLTAASGDFLANPPEFFHQGSFLGPRGAVSIADAGHLPRLEAMRLEFSAVGVDLQWLDRRRLAHLVPGLKPAWTAGLFEPSCRDIDVAALHGAYLAMARRNGAMLLADARVRGIQRGGTGWQLETARGVVEARILVNAAGAWADDVAQMAGLARLGITPFRRTMAQLRIDPPVSSDIPLVIDVAGSFYFKPEAGGRLWLSPHDETPCPAGDCVADAYDVASAVDRLQRAVDWRVEQVEHSWAGLRSFAPDRLPVFGFARDQADFFWYAGQGGFGIQTAPAAAKLAASMLLDRAPEPIAAGIDPEPYSPARFAN